MDSNTLGCEDVAVGKQRQFTGKINTCTGVSLTTLIITKHVSCVHFKIDDGAPTYATFLSDFIHALTCSSKIFNDALSDHRGSESALMCTDDFTVDGQLNGLWQVTASMDIVNTP